MKNNHTDKIIRLESHPNRIYMVNDKVLYSRFLAMKKLFPPDKINKNSHAILDTQGISRDK